MSETITHEHLLSICKSLLEDYTPYGSLQRWERDDINYSDYSFGCRWYAKLAGELGYDWGVCANSAGHRVGLLTFEHQGWLHFEPGDEYANVEEDGN